MIEPVEAPMPPVLLPVEVQDIAVAFRVTENKTHKVKIDGLILPMQLSIQVLEDTVLSSVRWLRLRQRRRRQ